MSSDAPQSSSSKSKLISLPFILVVGVIAVAVYFAAPTIMTYVMYWMPGTMIESPRMGAGEGDYADAGATDEEDTGGVAEGGRGGRGGGFDPEAFFAERDADGDGQLAGEEINERMQDRVAEMDADQDGAISKEEFMSGAGRRGGRGGGGSGRDESTAGATQGGDEPDSVSGAETSDVEQPPVALEAAAPEARNSPETSQSTQP